MEMLNTVVEAVVLSFCIGAIFGGVIVAHFQLKPAEQDEGRLQPAKVKANEQDQ